MKNILEEKRGQNFLGVFITFLILCIILGGMTFFAIQVRKLSDGSKKGEPRQYERYYAIIAGEGEEDFWSDVFEGAREAGMENGVYVEAFGSNLFNTYSREELMRIAIESKVDGIILEADDGEKMTELINEAVAKNIPVVTVLNDNMASERQSFVGSGIYNIGQDFSLTGWRIPIRTACRISG